MAPALRVLNLLNDVPTIEELVAQKRRDKLETSRVQLSGALDLYSV